MIDQNKNGLARYITVNRAHFQILNIIVPDVQFRFTRGASASQRVLFSSVGIRYYVRRILNAIDTIHCIEQFTRIIVSFVMVVAS